MPEYRSRQNRNKLLGDRIRSAVCVVLSEAERPLHLADIARAVEALGVPLGARSTKTLSDALRWEVGRGRILRCGRGNYRIGKVPRTTLIYMRRRVAAYARGETTPELARARRRLSESTSLRPEREGVTLTIDSIATSAPRLPLRPAPPEH